MVYISDNSVSQIILIFQTKIGRIVVPGKEEAQMLSPAAARLQLMLQRQH
jgi:hypothetical protein